MLKGNLAPDGCVIKPSALRAALPQAHRPGARVRRLPVDEGGGRRREPRRHGRPRARPAQRRPAGRPGHAGVGHAADPEEAREAGRARHAAHLRRAHERHELRRLRAARRARDATSAARWRCVRTGDIDQRRRAMRAASSWTCRDEELARRRAAWTPPRAALRARLRLDVLASTSGRPTRAATSTS